MGLETKSDSEIETWIRNHENAGATSAPLYLELRKSVLGARSLSTSSTLIDRWSI